MLDLAGTVEMPSFLVRLDVVSRKSLTSGTVGGIDACWAFVVVTAVVATMVVLVVFVPTQSAMDEKLITKSNITVSNVLTQLRLRSPYRGHQCRCDVSGTRVQRHR